MYPCCCSFWTIFFTRSSMRASASSACCQSLPRSFSRSSSEIAPSSSASRMASCSACIEWPSSSPGRAYGSLKPLDSSMSESFDSRSSRSTPSRSSGLYLEYRYFMDASVVILLLAAGHRDVPVEHRLCLGSGWTARLLDPLVVKVVRPADLLLCVESFEDEVDARGSKRLGRIPLDACNGGKH